jgi:hypothetical protein
MTEDQVHYEVFARRNPVAALSLHFATEDRQKALELAEELFAEGCIEVKVFKEVLDEETRAYRSVSILIKGATPVVERRRQALPDQPLCTSPQDLYNAHARERIGRLLDGWLRRRFATPFELLHRADLAELLDASGSELQHAVQKIAIPEAQARGMTTHESMRLFQKLAERTMDRIVKDAKAGRFPRLSPATFAAVVAEAQGEADRAYLIGAGVANHMADERSWAGKINRLLDLADAAPREPQARAFALAVIEQPLSEILASRAAVADMIGEEVDLAASLAAMTRLAASRAVETVVRVEPSLETFFSLRQTLCARLASWLRDPGFESVRVALLQRVLRELRGPRRLRPRSAAEEIEVMRALALALAAASGDLLEPIDVQQAFIERSRSILGGDFVNAYLQDREGPLAEAQALVRLAENVAGQINKTTAARWLMGVIMSLRFEKDARNASESPGARLSQLAALQKNVQRAGLSDQDTETISKAIGAVGGQVEGDCQLVGHLARSQAPPLQRLGLLLQLAAGESAPRGPAADRAKAEALKLLRKPDLRAELAGTPETLDRVRELVERAGLAA